jgi:rubrerythrin
LLHGTSLPCFALLPLYRFCAEAQVRTFLLPWRTRCSFAIAAEQKARVTYDNILRLSDDPDVNDVIKFLREREVVHFQRFGEAIHSKFSGFFKCHPL